MTAFIIIAIVIAVIACGQGVYKAYNKDTYRKSTITNVKLEKQLKEEWREKIDKKIDELNPPAGEMFNTLISLYDYYDVPLFGLVIGSITEAEKNFQEEKDKAIEDEKYATESEYTFDEFGFKAFSNQAEGFTKYNKEELPSKLLHIYIDKLAFSDAWRKYYANLVTLLTRRSLRDKGFNISRDGIHDSEWQEREKEHKKQQELREKYPWNYNDTNTKK